MLASPVAGTYACSVSTRLGEHANAGPSEKCSVFTDSEQEALRFKWIESERAGYDLGEEALNRWVRMHWKGYLRARWIEHLEGIRFWTELDKGDYGLLKNTFGEHSLLLDRIMDRLKSGQENLHVILWAEFWRIPMEPVLQILEMLDVNSRRLECQFGCD